MRKVVATRRINAPQDRVFEVMIDLAHAAGRISAIKRLEVLTPGPVGKGTRFRETRVMFGKEATEEMTITQWDPPRSYTVEARSCGCHYMSVITCRPEGGTTVVEMSFDAKPLTFMAKLMSPLGALMMGACRKAFEKDLDDIQKYIEHGLGTALAATS